ncbi:hypothetical protein ACFQX6_46620 [Streptosporangium lutulentum]
MVALHPPGARRRRPTELRLPTADALLFGLYGDAPAGIDEAALAMIGVRTTLAELLASHGGPDELIYLMGDPTVEVDRAQLRALWVALAAVEPARVAPRARSAPSSAARSSSPTPRTGARCPPRARVRTSRANRSWSRRLTCFRWSRAEPLILAPFDLAEALSELLDLPLAGEEAAGEVTSSGEVREVPPAVRSLLPTAPTTYMEHERLLVDGVPAAWRFFEGVVHATGVEGLARGLAWASGQWGDRLAVAALLRDPEAVPLLLAEADLDSWTASTN